MQGLQTDPLLDDVGPFIWPPPLRWLQLRKGIDKGRNYFMNSLFVVWFFKVALSFHNFIKSSESTAATSWGASGAGFQCRGETQVSSLGQPLEYRNKITNFIYWGSGGAWKRQRRSLFQLFTALNFYSAIYFIMDKKRWKQPVHLDVSAQLGSAAGHDGEFSAHLPAMDTLLKRLQGDGQRLSGQTVVTASKYMATRLLSEGGTGIFSWV